MENTDKDYIIDKAMTSIASFAAAARMTRAKLKNLISQPGVADMSIEQVLEYLVQFIEKETEDTFKIYDSFHVKGVSKSTTFIELIPEAPFNPEDKDSTISTLRSLTEGESFHLIQVYDEKGKPKFISIDEFEKNYYEYWVPVLRSYGRSEEEIENFKKGIA
jgi:hypothetical protein